MNKQILVAVGAIAVIVTAAAPLTLQPVMAVSQQAVAPITIPVDTVVYGNAGAEYKLAEKAIADGTYKVHLTAKNQDSVHPNTDIIVRSGASQVTIADVEGAPYEQKEADGTLTVTGGKVIAYVKLGKDKVFSGGVTIVLTYVPPVTPPATPEEPQIPEIPETPEIPEVLPATGPETVLLATAGIAGAGYMAARVLRRNRS